MITSGGGFLRRPTPEIAMSHAATNCKNKSASRRSLNNGSRKREGRRVHDKCGVAPRAANSRSASGAKKSTGMPRLAIAVLCQLLVVTLAAKKFIAPAFRWAQDPDSVYLRVRWAPELKIAPAPGVQMPPELYFHNTTRFELLASNHETSFHLQLQLWAQVSTNNITLMPTEKGHWGFALQKLKPRDAWPQLQPQGEAKPRNMRVWWDVQEKHQDALDALEMDSEEETDAHHDLFSGHGVDGADMSTLAERIDAGEIPTEFLAADEAATYKKAQAAYEKREKAEEVEAKKLSPLEYAKHAEKKDKVQERIKAGE